MAGFAELGLSSWLVEQCRQLGLKQPTPVQLGCIPAILEGKCGPASFPGSLPTLIGSLSLAQRLPTPLLRSEGYAWAFWACLGPKSRLGSVGVWNAQLTPCVSAHK